MPDWKAYVREHLPALVLRPEREREIVEELAQQLEQKYADAISGGASEAEAVSAAEAQIRDWQALARDIEKSERRRKRPGASGLVGDVRHAFRVMRKSPIFTLVAISTLAIAIGGCTAIFSLLNAVVLRDIGYRDSDQLVMVWEAQNKRNFHKNVVAMADYLDWKARTHAFSDLCIVLDRVWNLTGDGEPVEVAGIAVSARFLPMLGVQPLIGRSFLESEGRTGGPFVAILSYHLWSTRYHSDPSVIGQKITLDGVPETIIGVLPAGFPWLGKQLDVITPDQLPTDRDWRKKAGRFLRVAGRLKPGVTISQANREMNNIAQQLEVEYPEFNKDWGVEVEPMSEHFAAPARRSLWILMAAVALVLLIACSNIANLLLARAAGREREMALRSALGAGRGRLVRLLLIESLALALSGAVLGCAGAYAAVRMIQTYGPQDVPRLESATINFPTAVFAISASILAAVLFGLAPAIASARVNLAGALKESGRGVLGTIRGRRIRGALVVGEVALALVLLTAAALVLKSLARLSAVPTGFDPHNVLTATINISGKVTDAQLETMIHDMMRRMRELPGVDNASFITFLPFAGMGAATGFSVAGRPPYGPGEAPVTDVRVVQPGYFETMRIPLRRGRFFNDADNRDGGRRTFVVNETLAREMFGSSDPLGERLIVQMGGDAPGEIVGVVGDTKHASLDGAIRPMVYYAQAQLPISWGSFVVRTKESPGLLANAVVAAIREVKKDQAVSDIRSMDEWIGRSIAQQRFQTALLGSFAFIAVLLAMIGVYGVMSYSVEQRSHEIGVRLAVGAEPAALRRWVTGQGMMLAGAGLILGLAGAAVSTRVLKSLLYETSPGDPATFGGAAVLLAAVCLAAVSIPAHRATRVDPLVALRWE
jgi:putative ABC transport system permease protein